MESPLIRVQGVRFSYASANGHSVPVLEDLSFDCYEGECLCLLGPSGCGKTTVLRLLAGFEEPDEGILDLQGHPIVGPGAERGVVFQSDDSLFHWMTAVDNVAFGLKLRGIEKRERRKKAEEFLDLVGLSGQGRKYPAELSGGMKQRIQIARILANDPKILLLDEPFAALDAQTRAELQEELVRLWLKTHKTMLFITHDIAEAILLGQRIGVMRHGPGSNLRDIFPVELSRPRRHASPEFGVLYERVSGLIAEEVRLSRQPRNGNG